MSTNTLTDKLAALPGATASATNHASVGYDLSVALPESSLLAAATIMDEAGYFLECMTGVDWLGECETLRKEAEAKFLEWTGKKKFIPTAFFNKKQIENSVAPVTEV